MLTVFLIISFIFVYYDVIIIIIKMIDQEFERTPLQCVNIFTCIVFAKHDFIYINIQRRIFSKFLKHLA